MVCLGFEPGTVEWYEQTNLLSYSGPHYIWSFSKKMGQPWPLFLLFSSFQTNITILKTYKCEKMSFQYPAPGFKLTTFWLRVSSLNQWPGLPPLYLIFSLVVEMNINFSDLACEALKSNSHTSLFLLQNLPRNILHKKKHFTGIKRSEVALKFWNKNCGVAFCEKNWSRNCFGQNRNRKRFILNATKNRINLPR